MGPGRLPVSSLGLGQPQALLRPECLKGRTQQRGEGNSSFQTTQTPAGRCLTPARLGDESPGYQAIASPQARRVPDARL